MPVKVLLIDDSRTMREVFKVYLMGGRYDFIEADSGTRGLDLLRLLAIELVIADINMPRMDGFEFVKLVRASEVPRVRTVPIILVSSDKSEEVGRRARESQANAFLSKPVGADHLVEVVEELLREKGQ